MSIVWTERGKVRHACFEICYLRIVAQPPQVAQRLPRDAKEASSRCYNSICQHTALTQACSSRRTQERFAPSFVRRWLARCSRKVAESHSRYMTTSAHKFCQTKRAVLSSRPQAVTLPQHIPSDSYRRCSCSSMQPHRHTLAVTVVNALPEGWSHLASSVVFALGTSGTCALVFVLETSGTSAAPDLTCRDLRAQSFVSNK